MINNKHIEAFKSLNAEEDDNFSDNFVSTKYLSRILTKDSDIIYGTKGSGKSGLRLALSILNKDDYFITSTFDLTSLSFSAFYAKTAEINKMLIQEEHLISSAIWKNTILQFGLHSCIGKVSTRLSDKIQNLLFEFGFLRENKIELSNGANFKVMNQFERFFRLIAKFDKDESIKIGDTAFHLNAELDGLIDRFPIDRSFDIILNEVISDIEKENKTILICIDGLDKIVNHTFESRKAIFNGLIDAVYFFRFNSKLRKLFSIKAFLPQELTLETNNDIWDSDKHKHNTHYINWNSEDLGNFVFKRLQNSSRNKSFSKFDEAWQYLFPGTITNNTYGVDEDSFSYILRHTLHRPRQLQDHIFEILRDWHEKTGGTEKLPSSFIVKKVGETNRSLSADVVKHLSYNYPNILSFLLSWDNSDTTVKIHELKDRIGKYLLNDYEDKTIEINRVLDELYLFGIFGIDCKEEVQFKSKSKCFNFSFAGDVNLNLIHHSVKDNDIVGFSPMFREYCGLKKVNQYIISPRREAKY